MIVFDTNAVRLLPPDGPRADFIRKLRESGHHKVAVPWIVLEEMAAHQTKFYVERHQSAVNALQKLQEMLPWEVESSLESLDVERLLDHWRSSYGEIFEVIETSGAVALKALAREAMALPPAKRAKDHSEGARDVAIWFSILEYLRENPEERICFVTNNTNDFGDGISYSYPMDQDLNGVEDRLTRLKDFDQVISEFATEVSGADAERAAWELLSSRLAQSRLIQAAVEILTPPAVFVGLGDTEAEAQWTSWVMPPEAELIGLDDVLGHKIEGDIWYTATTQWLLYGVTTDGDDARNIACAWNVKLLFSANEDEDQTPTLLTVSDPSLPDMTDERTKEALEGLKKRAIVAARHTPGGYSANSFVTGSDLTRQAAAAMPKFDFSGIVPVPSVNMAEHLRVVTPEVHFPDLWQVPGQNIAQQLAAEMPRFDFSGIIQVPSQTQAAISQISRFFLSGSAQTSLKKETSSPSDDEALPNEDEETGEGTGA
ncbi:PIN domain-containing protein [Arthrobacter sp. Z1-15]